MRNHQSYRVILLCVLSVILILAFGSASKGMDIVDDVYRVDLREEGAFFDRGKFNSTGPYHVTINPFQIRRPAHEGVTIAFWVYTGTKTDGAEWRTPVSYAVPRHRNDEFIIMLQCGTDVYSKVYIDGYEWYTGLLYSNAFPPTWHHFAITWNNSSKEAIIYIDGTKKISKPLNANNSVNEEEGSLVFGQHQDWPGGGFYVGEAFDGGLRHVAIWDKVLTAGEIGRVKNGTPLSVVDENNKLTNPIGYWFWRPTLKSPDIRDDYVHVGVDDSVTFKPGSGEWERYVSGYEWSNCLEETGIEPNYFPSSSGGRYDFYNEGKKKVYCRANITYSATDSPYEVVPYSLPLRIPICVWRRPEVNSSPPPDLIVKGEDDTNGDGAYSLEEIQEAGAVSWLDGKYLGVVGEPVRMAAEGDMRNSGQGFPDETIPRYVWNILDKGEFEQFFMPDQFAGSESEYVHLQPFNMPSGDITVAFWVYTPKAASSQWRTPVSYAVKGEDNEFTIMLQCGKDVYSKVYIKGKEWYSGSLLYGNENPKWHHFALTWQKSNGVATIYIDGPDIDGPDIDGSGKVQGTLASGEEITSGGSLVFGQDQDSVGGGFQTDQAFVGELDHVAIWNRVLGDKEIGQISTASDTGIDTLNVSPENMPLSLHMNGDNDGLVAMGSTQEAIEYTPEEPTKQDGISCRAVNNYGIEGSSEAKFGLKIYNVIQLDPGGSYVGRTNRRVPLEGKMKNERDYYSTSTQYCYKWRVEDYDNGNIVWRFLSGDNVCDKLTAEYTWGKDGKYKVQLKAKVVTEEKLVIETDFEDEGAEANVIIQGGIPEAMPGTAYRGGIAGGDFSPIQFEGNRDYVDDNGETTNISDWVWSFADENSLAPGLVGEFYPIPEDPGNPDNPFDYLDEDGALDWIDERSISPKDVQIVDTPSSYNPGNGYFARFIGFIKIAAGGQYEFQVESAHGFRLQIGKKNEKTGKYEFTEVENEQYNSPGKGVYAIKLICFVDNQNSGTLGLQWKPPGGTMQTIDKDNFLSGGVSGGEIGTGGVRENGIWNPTWSYVRAGRYEVKLYVQADTLKWSPAKSVIVTAVDGKIEGFVRAADLRTPVPGVKLALTPDRKDQELSSALVSIGNQDDRLDTGVKDGVTVIYTTTAEDGYYIFEHLPLCSYKIVASKVEGGTIHNFGKNGQVAELKLSAPNSSIDFTDTSVFPVGGRIYYSILRGGQEVYVKDVTVTAQPVGPISPIEAMPSTRSLDNGINYSLPLFAGEYTFLAKLGGHDVRLIGTQPSDPEQAIIGELPGSYKNGMLTIEGATKRIDFIDYTTRRLTVWVKDSGGYAKSGEAVTISGDNGQADKEEHFEEYDDGKFVAILPPGEYTVKVPGADPEEKTVDLTGGDGEVTMTIPVQIKLSFVIPEGKEDYKPGLIGSTLTPEEIGKLKELLGLGADEDIPDVKGYMLYYPPVLRTHTYTIKAEANGNSVRDFRLFVTDGISMETNDPPQEQGPINCSEQEEYPIKAGLPKLKWKDEEGNYLELPLADAKVVTFRAEAEGYIESDPLKDSVTVLGDVPTEGAAMHEVSIPIVNYGVLHDPPGDGSYSYLDDTMTFKGVVSGMTIDMEGKKVPVYPAPWRKEREVSDFSFGENPSSDTTFKDMGDKGIMDPRTYPGEVWPAGGVFTMGGLVEAGTGALMVLLGPTAYLAQFAKIPILAVSIEEGTSIQIGEAGESKAATGIVQYEISPNRYLSTATGEDLRSDLYPDLVGPGRGDIYFGEGWTIALQAMYRLGARLYTDEQGKAQLQLETDIVNTYEIQERTNQYVYTIRDIENIISDLEATIDNPDTRNDEREKLGTARDTWRGLLNKNEAYVWHKNYASQGKSFDEFRKDNRSLGEPSETLIFSAGPNFEYSRRIHEDITTCVSIEVSAKSDAGIETGGEFWTGTQTGLFGTKYVRKMTGSAKIESSTNYGASWESGKEAEQVVGFVLNDDDIGDNITTYVYEDPIWGTPLFFQSPGSYTSGPWEEGTNKAVDVMLDLPEGESPTKGPFDYHDGAQYTVKVRYTGQRLLESPYSTVNFSLYAPQTDNKGNLIARFNGNAGPYVVGLTKEPSQQEATIAVSLYPPERDQDSADERQYEVNIVVQSNGDAQIISQQTLKPKFADLRAPRATIVSPYNGQRISPVFFPEADPFDIHVISHDTDLAGIKLRIRQKQSNGVWESWWDLSGMSWFSIGLEFRADLENGILSYSLREAFKDNGFELSAFATIPALEAGWEITDSGKTYLIVEEERQLSVFPDNVSPSKSSRPDMVPPYREFFFKWTDEELMSLGMDEYALCAVARDRADNTDKEPPFVVFVVDDVKPDVLTTIPDYQARENERIYRGELSVLFTDDMRADDFSDRTFEVTDLLEGGKEVAGFVSYSATLRKAIFVPVEPFKPSGFYRAQIKTDKEEERGIHDLAGNPLKSTFTWTFRTTDAPFEPTWSLTLKAINTDGQGNVLGIDANNVAGVEYGALDGEDEKDARSAPPIDTQMSLSFLNEYKEKFDRDIRPADGRLSHHWFFVIGNAKKGQVTIKYRPSVKLTSATRQYQVLRLVEFSVDSSGNASMKVIPLYPTGAIDEGTGEIVELDAYPYTVEQDGDTRYFRLDVQKADFVATEFQVGTSGWKFFSVPITPERADPFVNLGDDIDPFQMYQYDTATGGYKIYPLDLGEVSLQTGHGYFTRLNYDAAVDVGGSPNRNSITLELETAGWHAIGNPFPVAVMVADLELKEKGEGDSEYAKFGSAGALVEGTLYRWKTDGAGDTYDAVGNSSQLLPWEGYWIKTKQDDVTIKIPAPSEAELDDAYKILPDSYKPPVMAPPAVDSRRIAVQPGEFDLRLALTSSSSADTTTTLGARQKARIDWDPMDQSEPPILGETVAAYFHHPDWGDDSGSYNRDYQPVLSVGDERTWRVTVYTDKPGSQMKLSWEESISQVPDDVMIYFRRADTGADDDWQDMRKVRSIDLESRLQFTSIPMEIRAQRYEMRPPSGVQAIPGEKLVALRWEPDDNEFIDGYIITRQDGSAEDWRDGEGVSYSVSKIKGGNVSEFVDRDVLEEVTYTYQLRVRFMSGAELGSQLFTVRTLPIIKQTALMRCYPNPFNPEVWIPYDLAEEASVSVEIYSVSGQLVRTLDLGVQQRGRYASRDKAAYWDGLNQAGEKSASGVYFYVLKAGKFSASKKMALIR